MSKAECETTEEDDEGDEINEEKLYENNPYQAPELNDEKKEEIQEQFQLMKQKGLA